MQDISRFGELDSLQILIVKISLYKLWRSFVSFKTNVEMFHLFLNVI